MRGILAFSSFGLRVLAAGHGALGLYGFALGVQLGPRYSGSGRQRRRATKALNIGFKALVSGALQGFDPLALKARSSDVTVHGQGILHAIAIEHSGTVRLKGLGLSFGLLRAWLRRIKIPT